jgi:hypothetical protein
MLDIRMLSITVSVRWLWLEQTEPSRPWAAIKVGADKVTSTFFEASILLVLGNGVSFLFWTDPWLHGRRIVELAPNMFNAMPLSCRKQRTVASAVTDTDKAWTQGILPPPPSQSRCLCNFWKCTTISIRCSYH